jgi:nicotinamidase-related amidase
MTDICVLATVVGGMNREYRMTVVGDATATLSPEIQRAALDIIGRAYARVVTTSQVAGEIGRW